VIEVRDRGPGIPAGEEERIFEPFHTTRMRGTGLGLAVARRIVSLHGGTIAARNGDDGGAVFTIELPRGGVKAG
jgi:two-component system sensor histidine kinase HydH